MTLDDFVASIDAGSLPTGLGVALEALWCQGCDDWQRAHGLVQSQEGPEAAWVHAHLHRVEGDLANAGYWYRRAGKPQETGPLDAEWRRIAEALLHVVGH